MRHILFAPWKRFQHIYATVAYVRLAVLGMLVGVFSGIGAILFFLGIEYTKHYILTVWAGMNPPSPAGESLGHVAHFESVYRPYVVVIATTVTGLLTGWLVQRFLPNSLHGMTDGTDAMIKAFHKDKGVIHAKAPIIKGLTSILTIGSGGALGVKGQYHRLALA